LGIASGFERGVESPENANREKRESRENANRRKRGSRENAGSTTCRFRGGSDEIMRRAKGNDLRENESEPTARAILDAVERLLTDERSSATRHRYARAEARFEAHLEALGERMLTGAGVAVLWLERSIEPTGALFRVATGEDLLYALRGFISLERPARLPTSDVRAQLRFAEETRRYIMRHGLVDVSLHMCAVWDIDSALRRARGALRSRGAMNG
jgi:hypothetical protein